MTQADQDHCRLKQTCGLLRRWIIEQSHASNVGHIGSALGIVEIVVALWGEVLKDPGTQLPTRDRFVLSKGHAVLALYGALRFKGLLSAEQFATYCGEGSLLGAHPEHALPGIDVSTGSLGQGLSIGCGLAYGLRQHANSGRVFTLVSDAECNEGQVWEAAMFAAHHRLTNLVAIVDLNGMQALGRTREVLSMDPPADRWRAFGWDAQVVDGHNLPSLVAALSRPADDRPRVVLARTMLGKGISFMEDRLEWHYRNLTDELCRTALAELEAAA
jgi:transketolase